MIGHSIRSSIADGNFAFSKYTYPDRRIRQNGIVDYFSRRHKEANIVQLMEIRIPNFMPQIDKETHYEILESKVWIFRIRKKPK